MKKPTLRKLGIVIGVLSGVLSTIIYFLDSNGGFEFAVSHFGMLFAVCTIVFMWAVGIGFSMLIAKHLSSTIGIEEVAE